RNAPARDVEHKPAVVLPVSSHFWDGLVPPSPSLGDLVQRPPQRGPGDALASMLRVYVEARDPPVRPGRRILAVFAAVLNVRKFLRAAVLAPPLRDPVVIKDQRRMRAALPNPGLLRRAIVDRPSLAWLEVKADAPASAEDAVIALDELREDIPGGLVKWTDCVRHGPYRTSASGRSTS